MRIVRTLALVVVALLMAFAASAQPTLTGMVEFSTNSAGSAFLNQVWNTLGFDATWNLYVIPGAIGGTFVNTGDGAGMSISIPLAPGTHTFALHGDFSETTVQYMGLNLFFAGDNTNPRISVFGADGLIGGTPTGGSTYTLAGAPTPGANSVSFTADGYRVTLSEFLYRGNFSALDRVSPHSDSANARNDNLVTFTLTVEFVGAVPTLSTAGIAALGLLVAAAAFVALRRLG
jgi:hypothetical protein